MSRAPVAPGAYRDRVPPLAPHAEALNAFEAGDTDTQLRLRSSLGEDELLPVEFFFRTDDAMLSFERYALELCRGCVLDLGAGAGPQSKRFVRRASRCSPRRAPARAAAPSS